MILLISSIFLLFDLCSVLPYPIGIIATGIYSSDSPIIFLILSSLNAPTQHDSNIILKILNPLDSALNCP